MKNIVYLLVLSVVLTSCKAMKMYKKEEIVAKPSGVQKFEIKNKRILLTSKIDNKDCLLFFDTGAMVTDITDTLLISNFSTLEKSTFGSGTDALGKNFSILRFPASFENDLFSSKNKVITYVSKAKSTSGCPAPANVDKIQGIFGIDFFEYSETNFLLDFSNSQIEVVSQEKQNQLIAEGFKEIKSKFPSFSLMKIFLNINGKEYAMDFDTGNTSSLVLPYKEVENFKNLQTQKAIGITHFSVAGASESNTTYYYNDAPISVGNENVKSALTVSENLKIYNVGLGFIKGFDWIIDYKNKKVYYRKNNLEISTESTSPKIGAMIQDEKLKIVLLAGEFINQYNLGDEIVSVNGEKVTTENICEMRNLVLTTEDQNTLKIEIKKN
ncbi:MAG: hypothetical protein LBE36_12725 [Flavobacteriaceae bacterium]|jgi:hypothetical protein|nr:hypothetical protein [Flavobacteriaceae bacterium]